MKFFGYEIGDAEEFLKDIEQTSKSYWTTSDGYHIDSDEDSVDDFLAAMIEWRMAKLSGLNYYNLNYYYIHSDGKRSTSKFWRSVFAKDEEDAKKVLQNICEGLKIEVVDVEKAPRDTTIYPSITL